MTANKMIKGSLAKAGFAACSLLLASGLTFAQSTVTLTAAPTSTTLPDGQNVPMWGWSCGTVSGAGVSCTAANGQPQGGGWQPPLITVPANQPLTITLKNTLSFSTGPGTPPNSVPTSLVIVGQLGGGLGLAPSRNPSPVHADQGTTWPIAAPSTFVDPSLLPPGTPPTALTPSFRPPSQPDRVRSFATEVTVADVNGKDLTWFNLRPGTYLIQSGTQPSIQAPMGLYGVLVVTDATYPGVAVDKDAVVLLSEIDAVQNKGVDDAVRTAGFNATATMNIVDKVSAVIVLDGGSGYAPGTTVTLVGGGGTGATATATVVGGAVTDVVIVTQGSGYTRAPDVLFTNTGGGSGAIVQAALSLAGTACSGNAAACYPPAVNYDPRYYLVNGAPFDRGHPNASTVSILPAPASAANGRVLLRLVNAGLRMHVPSVVGLSMSLLAEDANILPGLPKKQSQVFLAAGKTYDVTVEPAKDAAGLYTPATYAIFDRQLSLSTNNQRDGGMQTYLQIAGGALPGSALAAAALPDNYFLVAGNTLEVTDPAKGLMANDTGVYGVQVLAAPANGTLTLNANGTFTYKPTDSTVTSDSFTYQANGNPLIWATVTLAECTVAAGCKSTQPVVANDDAYTSNVASRLQISPPGVLSNDRDPSGLALKASALADVVGGDVMLNPDGSFTVTPTIAPTVGTTAQVTFKYAAVNSQNTASNQASVTVTFNGGSGLAVKVVDALSIAPGKTPVQITDYRWIIEEDRTFDIDPKCQSNVTPRPATCPPLPVPALGVNFHTSYMPVVAQGCVGTVSCESGQTLLGEPAVCDIGNGGCRTGASQRAEVNPSQVALDPTKRYYISILPGDGGNPFAAGAGGPVDMGGGKMRPFSIALDCPSGPAGADFAPGTGTCGHTMGGGQIKAGQTSVTVPLQQSPLPTTKIAVFVFQDDTPLNGENDTGTNGEEAGLGEFQITLFDDAGGTGDATGQMTYDMFNMPLSNSLAGTIDPATGLDACPLSRVNDGLLGMIVTCPRLESDGRTVSPLAGQAVIVNMMPGRYGVQANPGASRIARGEEWLQTNTLDGGKPHDAFIKAGGPAYFQEFGPGGYHVAVGFANPKIINARLPQICARTHDCTNTLTGMVSNLRMNRPPHQGLYRSGSHDAYGFTQCFVSVGGNGSADFQFTKCDADGKFTFTGLPSGTWRVTVFDQWNDSIIFQFMAPPMTGTGADMGEISVLQWRANIYTRTFMDLNGDGVSQDNEPGLPLVATNIRFRDGSVSNFNNTDLNGFAGFNEIFPLFSWYVLDGETATTRYKSTGAHVVYDAGGPADKAGGGDSTIGAYLANTKEAIPLPADLRVPGAVYCSNADCTGFSILNGPASSQTGSTGRIDPPSVTTLGWQGFLGQASFVEFGKALFAPNENGGIKGEVIYASTRPFDDPALLLHLSWSPNVPNVTVNLYQQGTAPDGTQSLKLVDTTKTTSWDDWAQGFRADGMPNMNCPGQGDQTKDPFFYTIKDSRQWLNPGTALPHNSQFKCYDGMHVFNQLQPAPYDGMYKFPSVTATNPATGKPAGTNCTICVDNPTGDGTKMLPSGKYVVEIIVPQGYELVKEEDKNILIGDNYIAPVTMQFGGLGSIFILPDQAAVNAKRNPYNPQNPSTDLGSSARNEGDTGSVENFHPCAGAMRIVPDFISLFPGSQEVAPFAGATRPLCDRKAVTLNDQMSVLAKFYVFSSTHVAAHFTGFMLDDYSSEFDPYSPQFGEKFALPNAPISFKDFNGVEIGRFYADQWGIFNGLNYSTWQVNPPNPTGYAPTMMVTCMNDPGPIPDPAGSGKMIQDPHFNPGYSQFCYEMPFMPGQTQYMDTPVLPTMAFASGYNPPDCEYPDATPAIASVVGNDTVNAVLGSSGKGPWVNGSGAGHTLTITALGDKLVPNHGYSGPQATASPFNQRKVTRHYGFGTQGTGSKVTIAGVNAPVISWLDTEIKVTVPDLGASSTCTVAQRNRPAGTTQEKCGQLVITADNGKQSVDAVTVTIGGKAPAYVDGTKGDTIQAAIDNAAPGDLIIVAPGAYTEMLLMWKPVRLQGVGAASVTLNANTHPSGMLLGPWRRQVNCLFGLTLNGRPMWDGTPYDPSGVYNCPASMKFQVDRIDREGIVGWDADLNGNLAQLLQEPTLMGAYEGAGITVLAKGVRFPAGVNPFPAPRDVPEINPPAAAGTQTEGAFPVGTVLLTNGVSSLGGNDCNDYPSNFLCNPSRIDGLSITNSSQGGGGIFVHGWGHNLEISNNRVFANAGTLSGGINVGQGEFPDAVIAGEIHNGVLNPNPRGEPDGTQLEFQFNKYVHVHHNAVTQNMSYGDELFSATPSGAGGVGFCSGSDYYKFDYNWICGNLSTGDGGGVNHIGFSWNGLMEKNTILFNQSANPTLPTHGGGIVVMGAGPDGQLIINGVVTECGSVTDADCPPSLSDGTGPGLVINANLIMGNSAESGSGGGIRLQGVNGLEVSRFPNRPQAWYGVTITNNMIVNNVAGWDGGGVSIQDSLKVDFINNTVMSNDSTASSGVLWNMASAYLASVPPPGCDVGPIGATGNGCTNPVTTSKYLAAGLVTMAHTPNLIASLPTAGVTCPAGHGESIVNGKRVCAQISYPRLVNNLFWQNRSFYITIGTPNPTLPGLQNTVTLNPQLTQGNHQTGFCALTGVNGGPGPFYWDIGVRGDNGPTNHGPFKLSPTFSLLTGAAVAADYGDGAAHNLGADPSVVSQYCNGSRVPPENGGLGYNVPPGVFGDDASLPVPLFSLIPVATVDEGGNWINMTYGPLSMTNSALYKQAGVALAALGDYTLKAGSPAIDRATSTGAPSTDFFGRPRPQGMGVDIGAFEFPGAIASVTGGPLAFGSVTVNTTSQSRQLVMHNTGAGALSISPLAFSSARFSRAAPDGGTCGPTLGAGATCTINVVFQPLATGAQNATLTITGNAVIAGSPVSLSGTGQAPNVSITGGPLAFGLVNVNTTSASQTLTLNNNGTAALTGIALVFPASFERAAAPNAGTCTATLAQNATCTIGVVFKPLAAGATPAGTALTINDTGNFPVSGSKALSGTGAVPTVTGLLGATGNFGNAFRGLGSGMQAFALNNIASDSLTGVQQATLTGANAADFTILRMMSTCGPSGNGQLLGQTTLGPVGSINPLASCAMTVRFTPRVGFPTGAKAATLTVTDVAGTQTFNLTGVAQ